MLHTLSWQRQKNVDYSCLSVVHFSCSGDVCFLAATSWVRGTSSSELSESSTRVFFSVIIQDYLKQDDSIIIINFHSNFFNYCVLSFVKRDLPQNLTIVYFNLTSPDRPHTMKDSGKPFHCEFFPCPIYFEESQENPKI